MSSPIINIGFRQIIDQHVKSQFEKNVFNDSYQELLLQMQAYNRNFSSATFIELIQKEPKANSLHYKVGFAIGLYVRELNNIIPSLHDKLGQPVTFKSHRLEIIDSDFSNQSKHLVAVHYYSGPLRWLGTIGEWLLLSKVTDEKAISEEVETFMLKMEDGLSICSLKQDLKAEKWQGSSAGKN